MEKKKIGYARVSTKDQKLDRQITALKKPGCKKIFQEKKSGKNTINRPELEKAISALSPGDILVVAEWDRATRSMQDGIKIMERVHAREAGLKALDRDWLDLTSPIGKGILAFLSALAEDERQRITNRANQGRTNARKKGVRFGRKPKLTKHQREQVLKMLEKGNTMREAAKLFNVGVATIARAKEFKGVRV